MNRIILIGNGFDIAHGMKTSYKDFINDFWKNKGVEIIQNQEPHECEFLKLNKPVDGKFSDLSNFSDFNRLIKKPRIEAEIKNKFFWNLCQKQSLENWVDIENERYQRLKQISIDNNLFNKKQEKLQKLNKDFDQVKKVLSKYIIRVEDDFNEKNILKIRSKIITEIHSKFKYRDLSHTSLKSISKKIYNNIKSDLKALENDTCLEDELTDTSRKIRSDLKKSNLTVSNIFSLISKKNEKGEAANNAPILPITEVQPLYLVN